eukprot:552124-Amphidinium_carterae.1
MSPSAAPQTWDILISTDHTGHVLYELSRETHRRRTNVAGGVVHNSHIHAYAAYDMRDPPGESMTTSARTLRGRLCRAINTHYLFDAAVQEATGTVASHTDGHGRIA